MKRALTVFVDSDVIISSVISQTGAANFLLNQKNILLFASNYSQKEIKVAAKKLKLGERKLENIFKNKLKTVVLKDNLEKIKARYTGYVVDENDSHVIAGAVEAKVKFLISYNVRHYKIDKIKTDFGIILLTPALFLQFLRSI